MTMSYGGTAAVNKSWQNSPNVATIYGSTGNLGYTGPEGDQPAQTAQSLFGDSNNYALDWSSGTAFSFDISGYSSTGTYNTAVLTLIATDWNNNSFSKTLTLVNGHVDVAFSDFTGVDFSNLNWTGFQFENTDTTLIPAPGAGITTAVPTGTVSISNFGYLAPVPAPGAAALIGLAGLVSSRRRRN
jgi:MYXO-CTERM domain-containing protein